MADEKVYQGLRAGDTWLAKGPITYPQAEELILSHLRGANLDTAYFLDEEGDHLAIAFGDKDEPGSAGYPGSNAFPKDQVWGSVGKTHSDKRSEYPNP